MIEFIKFFMTESKSEQSEGRPTAALRGYNYEWQKQSSEFLNDNPKCEDCGAKSKLVHHRTPHNGNKKKFWDRRNWKALCKKCHRD